MRIPPSKSYLHRGIICGGLASGNGETVLQSIALSRDIQATCKGIEALTGRRVLQTGDRFRIQRDPTAVNDVIQCGESGSTLRLLIPLAALADSPVRFIRQGRLPQRPLQPYRDAGLNLIEDGDAVIVRGPLSPGTYTLPGNVSSQFLSGLLFALPLLPGDSEIELTAPLESKAYVEMTVEVMEKFGVRVESRANGYRIAGNQRYQPAELEVEADYSQAAFFLGAGALGREVWCEGLNPDSSQGDRAVLDILARMGASPIWRDVRVRMQAAPLQAVTVDAREIPDLAPPLAAVMCFCEGTSRIEHAERLRLKESDRLHAIALELGKLGARIQEQEAGLLITGSATLRGGLVDSHNDHRIAMALALAAIRCEQPVTIENPQCINKSYPDFWRDFEREER